MRIKMTLTAIILALLTACSNSVDMKNNDEMRVDAPNSAAAPMPTSNPAETKLERTKTGVYS
jgi:hypothetical protein